MTLNAALAWQVYEVSGSTFQLGLLGMVRFIPALSLSLLAGAVADSFPRQRVIAVAQCVPMACSATLAVASAGGWVSLPLIYALVLPIGIASAFEAPARQAFLPSLVKPETFTNAVTVNATLRQMGFVVGPGVGGLLIAGPGAGAAYGMHAGLMLCALITLWFVRPLTVATMRRAISVAAVREGIQFVRHRQVLWGAMALDMFAVIFGGASALLPVYAEDILGVGASGYGMLLASYEAGSFLIAGLLIFAPPIRRTGSVLLITVAMFGVFTVVFGFSEWFWLSLLSYAAIGMANQVSVVLRQAAIQLSTPDELRGRVSSVNQVFLSASVHVGAMESGFVAALAGPVFAVVSGGLACVGVVAWVAKKAPDLRRYRIPRAEIEEDEGAAAAAGNSARQAGGWLRR